MYYQLLVCVLLIVLVKLSVLGKLLARKTPLKKPNRGEGIVSYGLRGCKNRPAPFPGRMSYKASKPGLVLFYILACLLGALFMYC